MSSSHSRKDCWLLRQVSTYRSGSLHENGNALSPNELKEAEGVHTIEITVRSEAWDELEPKKRVDLLNKTFKFIKDRFPDMTKFLRLAYDDDRPSFDMKFGAEI